MKNSVLKYGSYSGILSAAFMAITMHFMSQIGFGRAEYVGYVGMFLSFTPVYFGIRSYRDGIEGGTINFGKAFIAGILMAGISSLFYVIAWLIIYYNFTPNFMDEYSNYMLGKMQASGATKEALDKATAEMVKFREYYKNPLFNAAITFTEPLPVALLICILSAFMLKKKAAPANQ